MDKQKSIKEIKRDILIRKKECKMNEMSIKILKEKIDNNDLDCIIDLNKNLINMLNNNDKIIYKY